MMNANEYAPYKNLTNILISAENTVQLSHPHAAVMHLTLTTFSTKIMRTVIFTIIQQFLE